MVELEAKVTELEASISRKIKESEVAMLQELLEHLKERDTVEVSELVEQQEEEVIDFVPCCGREDNLTNVDVVEGFLGLKFLKKTNWQFKSLNENLWILRLRSMRKVYWNSN